MIIFETILFKIHFPHFNDFKYTFHILMISKYNFHILMFRTVYDYEINGHFTDDNEDNNNSSVFMLSNDLSDNSGFLEREEKAVMKISSSTFNLAKTDFNLAKSDFILAKTDFNLAKTDFNNDSLAKPCG